MELILGISALCALTTVVCVLTVRYSGPVAASKLLREMLERVELCEATIRTKKIELEGLAEAMAIDKTRAVAARNRASALERKQVQRDERDLSEPTREPTREDYELAISRRGGWGMDS